MNKNNQEGKLTKVTQAIYGNRKLIMLLLIFVILPIVCISTLYIGEYSKNKPEIFTDVEAQYVNEKQLESKFEFNLIATKYTEPTFNKDDSVNSSGNIKFSIEVGEKLDKNIDSNGIEVQLMAGAYWIGYSSNKSSTVTVDFNESKTTTIYSFNEKFPQKPLFLVNIDKEDVYIFALLTWKEKVKGSSEYKEVNMIVKYNYSDYIDNDTNFQ